MVGELVEKLEGGRPTLYTQELSDKICAQITVGISLATICKEDLMPCPATIYNWLRVHKEFLDNYEKAKDNQADYFVEQMLTIPDTEEDVQRARLKVDVRKWAASKFKPKKYGEKVDLDHTTQGEKITWGLNMGGRIPLEVTQNLELETK